MSLDFGSVPSVGIIVTNDRTQFLNSFKINVDFVWIVVVVVVVVVVAAAAAAAVAFKQTP